MNVVYTPFLNLRKDGSMDVGQVGFHNEKERKIIKVDRDNSIVKRIMKTKKEEYFIFIVIIYNSFPDLKQEWIDRQNEDKKERKAQYIKQQEQEKKEREEARKQKELAEYKTLMKKQDMTSNTSFEKSVDNSAAVNYEEDFM